MLRRSRGVQGRPRRRVCTTGSLAVSHNRVQLAHWSLQRWARSDDVRGCGICSRQSSRASAGIQGLFKGPPQSAGYLAHDAGHGQRPGSCKLQGRPSPPIVAAAAFRIVSRVWTLLRFPWGMSEESLRKRELQTRLMTSSRLWIAVVNGFWTLAMSCRPDPVISPRPWARQAGISDLDLLLSFLHLHH